MNIGISRGALSSYERDESQPSADTLQKICAKYAIAPEWLLMGSGPMWQQQSAHAHEPEVSMYESETSMTVDECNLADLRARVTYLEKELARVKESEITAIMEAKEAYKMAFEAVRSKVIYKI